MTAFIWRPFESCRFLYCMICKVLPEAFAWKLLVWSIFSVNGNESRKICLTFIWVICYEYIILIVFYLWWEHKTAVPVLNIVIIINGSYIVKSCFSEQFLYMCKCLVKSIWLCGNNKVFSIMWATTSCTDKVNKNNNGKISLNLALSKHKHKTNTIHSGQQVLV